jgi:hypothetical protein
LAQLSLFVISQRPVDVEGDAVTVLLQPFSDGPANAGAGAGD